jgi:RNA polymerase sigma-70 factor (ECF subfamily)
MGTNESQRSASGGEWIEPVRRDRAAFLRLYRRYYDDVFRYCVHRLFDRHAAEDVTAEVFLKIVESLDRFEGRDEDQLRTWVYRIATNAINGHVRKTLRRRGLLRRFAQPGSCDTVDPPGGPDERIGSLKAALLGLKPRYQTVITLRFFENLKPIEIAETLGSSPGTVRSQLARAIEQLRMKLTAAGVFPPGDECDG